MIKAAIFDLDGTLSDSIYSIKFSCDLALKPYGYGPFSEKEYMYFVGDGARTLVERALHAAASEQGMKVVEEVFASYKEIFAEHCMDGVAPYEGILELLHALKEKGIKLAVLSNKPHEETIRVIHQLFGENIFDVIQGQTKEYGVKPNPAGGLHVCELLGVAGEEVLYLGDTATDMKTGKGLGAFTVGVLWGFREEKELTENKADAIIAHPLEALQYI